jgi:hypothetical protein
VSVATTAFVQAAFTVFLAASNTFSLVQNFLGNIAVNYTSIASNTGSASTLGYSTSTTSLPATLALSTGVVKNFVSFNIAKGVWFITINLQVNITTANATVSLNTFGLYTSVNTVNSNNSFNKIKLNLV